MTKRAKTSAGSNDGSFAPDRKPEASGVELAQTYDRDTVDVDELYEVANAVVDAAEEAGARRGLSVDDVDAMKVSSYLEEEREHLTDLGLYEYTVESEFGDDFYVSTPEPHVIIQLDTGGHQPEYVTAFAESTAPFYGTDIDVDSDLTVGDLRRVRAACDAS